MKKILTLFSIVMLALSMQAQNDDPRHPVFTMKQSDGTQIQVRCHANARTNYIFYTTLDGAVLVRDSKGDLCYAEPQGEHLVATSTLAHEPQQRNAAEVAVAARALNAESAYTTLSPRTRLNPVGRMKAEIATPSADGLGTYKKTAGGAVNSIGEYTIPVVLVSFADVSFKKTNDKQAFDDMLNKEGYNENTSVGSVRDYFISQSSGLFQPKFEIIAEVTLDKHEYYGYDEGDRKDQGLWTFINEVFAQLKQQKVDLKPYRYKETNNGVPLVSLLYAGTGQATSGVTNDIWPCELDINTTFNGVLVNSVFVGNELNNGKMAGMGTFCHEFGHALGLPDIYCTNYGHSESMCSYWSVMEHGCYEGNGYRPIGYMAHEKNFLGWLEIPELKEEHYYTLYDMNSDKQPHAVLVRNAADSKEYYILENRNPDTWYPSSYGSGMLVTHVHYNKTAWASNAVNNDKDHLRYVVVPAGVTLRVGQTDLYPTSANKTLHDKSKPPTSVYSGDGLKKPIYKITRNKTDKTITFAFMSNNPPRYSVGDTVEVKSAAYDMTCLVERDYCLTVLPRASRYSGDFVIPSDTIDFDNRRYCVTAIDANAFQGCTELNSVTIGNKVERIGTGAFSGATALQRIEVAAGNENFESRNGFLFTRKPDVATVGEVVADVFDFTDNKEHAPVSLSISDNETGHYTGTHTQNSLTLELEDGELKTTLWQMTSGGVRLHTNAGSKTTVVAPDGFVITGIAFVANSFNMSVADGTLEGKVWKGEAARVTFTGTASSVISKLTVTMRRVAQTQWKMLQAPLGLAIHCIVPDAVGIIAPMALAGSKFTEVTLPSSLTELGADAVSIAPLKRLYSLTAAPAATTPQGDPFTAVDKAACELHIPVGAKPAYAEAAYWKDFVKVFDDVTTGINDVRMGRSASQTTYDLQGRQVETATQKGVYIRGGRKIVK